MDNGKIEVVGDTLFVVGVHFAATPSVDAGPLNLMFKDCMTDRHECAPLDLRGKNTAIVGNVFGVPSPPKPRWRFW